MTIYDRPFNFERGTTDHSNELWTYDEQLYSTYDPCPTCGATWTGPRDSDGSYGLVHTDDCRYHAMCVQIDAQDAHRDRVPVVEPYEEWAGRVPEGWPARDVARAKATYAAYVARVTLDEM